MRDSAVNQTVIPQLRSTSPLHFHRVFHRPQLNLHFWRLCEASIVMSFPSVYLLNVLSDRQGLNAAGQLIHFMTNALCFGNLRRCSLCSGCSSFNSDREVLKGNFAHVWEEAEKAVLVRVLELRGADMWSVTATIVGAERDEGHGGHFLPTILLLNGWIKPHVSFNLSSWAKTKPGNSSEWAERRSPLLACEPSVGDIDAQLIIVVWHHWHKQRECGDSLC